MQTETQPEALTSFASPVAVARRVARPAVAQNAASDEKLATPTLRYVMVGILVVGVVAATAFAVARQGVSEPVSRPSGGEQTIQPDPVQLNKLLEAVNTNPADFDSRMSLGDYYYQTGDYAAAVAAYSQAVQQKPTDLGGQESLGNAYLHASDFPKAAAALRKVYEADPTRATVAISLCIALAEQSGAPRAEGQALWAKIRPMLATSDASKAMIDQIDAIVSAPATPKP